MVVFKHEGQSFLAEYPQLREAETEASGRLPATTVQRLATSRTVRDMRHAWHGVIAPHIRNTTISTAADTTTESGGISA